MTASPTRVAPSARRLTGSLRDVGYSFEAAVADLIDNSITAGATRVSVDVRFAGRDSWVLIADNGSGMDSAGLDEALRFGSQRAYGRGDLGRYGLGLKTASLSQCRRVSVYSRNPDTGHVDGRCLDLDFIDRVDDWMIVDPDDAELEERVHGLLDSPTGTVVAWQNLDRLLPAKNPDGSWARKKFSGATERLAQHLETVFHRFLSGEAHRSISISVNGESLTPWDPFARDESATKLISNDILEVGTGLGSGKVSLRAYCLPSRSQFSSLENFERTAGPRKWNRQQGIYVYRADRLVQWGGWDGIRTIDEHTKLARVALDFDTDLDDEFNINVAKMRVNIPHQLKKMMGRAVADVCAEADSRYRKDQKSSTSATGTADSPAAQDRDQADLPDAADLGLALKSAAARSGNYAAFREISRILHEESPELAKRLGL
ncbi:ATP-binding protein [Corynebacterium bovis]|uniref:ATP-binding protein n=1 Tax=Corynebacterium bovis DSM 20582 = CIP 54.80 TaxID=927655 RepID=A0A8H9Y7R3_9CORY|nr:ATP-binding protein [Corynebacterium bovis]MBB3116118.1 hypothetical protein [Corynebacterium bovis DSM 20582 = CIP 54.80]QQC47044.1 ATP-binding protein [Corynebacterium bovis]RRO81297.1 ATP-binding protein [Corynebacterium bovis]RRO85327.1 ATP-binding protein [Corynebacterium bovis]RRO95940.1 ATP-binding protein [Corynebacterium bovis]